MKFLFIAILYVCSISACFSQKTKTSTIISRPLMGEYVKILDFYNEKDELQNKYILFLGKDDRYTHISSFITLFRGEPDEFYDFLISLEKFAKEEEKGTGMTLGEHRVRFTSSYGFNLIDIYEKEGSGYHSTMPKSITKIKKKFIDWAKKNNVKYIIE